MFIVVTIFICYVRFLVDFIRFFFFFMGLYSYVVAGESYFESPKMST